MTIAGITVFCFTPCFRHISGVSTLYPHIFPFQSWQTGEQAEVYEEEQGQAKILTPHHFFFLY